MHRQIEIEQWAADKGILEHGTTGAQHSKTLEEVSELVYAIAQEDLTEIADGVGDVCVTLIIQCRMRDWSMAEVIQHYSDCVDCSDCITELNICATQMTAALHLVDAGRVEPDRLKREIARLFWTCKAVADDHDLTVDDCIELAYNEIVDRKGKMEGGVFVKA